MSKDTSFYKLTINDKVRETADAVTLYFDIPESLKDTFAHKAGQYLTLRFDVKGKDQRRSYSLCTPPGSAMPGVTVKKVKGGVVSTYIFEEIQKGDEVEVMPPDGKFTVTPDPELRKTYYFFGAGSGITPLMSQIQALLEDEPMSVVHLYYGNRNPESIIFKYTLEQLESKYNEQLTVDHILSKPTGKGGFLGSIFKKKSSEEDWTGETGRIDTQKVKAFLDKYPAHTERSVYLICGPGNMIEGVRNALAAHGVSKDDILTEYFTPSSSAKSSATVAATPANAKAYVTLRGEEIEIDVNGKTILETLQDAGYDPPYSCTSGACASCMAKITEGNAEMEMCFALDDGEIADGYVLTCQAHPTSKIIKLTYDV